MALGRQSITVFALCTMACAAIELAIYLPPMGVRAQSESSEKAPRAYNPYPAGILPPDLDSELARVLRETDVLEGRALARWRALKAPVLTGQPPVLADTGTEAIETLGELMLFDKNISPYRNEACSSCH